MPKSGRGSAEKQGEFGDGLGGGGVVTAALMYAVACVGGLRECSVLHILFHIFYC